jgi:hypothetical protein
MESGSTPPGTGPDNRIPRGAIAIVVVGLIATLAAALLTTGKGSGEAAHLEFVQQRAAPDSKPVVVPGSKDAQMQLVENRIQATGTNFGEYELFRAVDVLKIDKGAPIGGGRIVCTIHALGRGTLIGQSSNGLRTLYPRSSEEGIFGQSIPETILVRFSSHGYELATLEVFDLKQPRFATIKGVKLDWPAYEEETEHLDYFLPEGKAKATVELPFYSVWRTQEPPAAKVSCRLEVAAGKATVKTESSLPKLSPPINEEAEEAKQEEREEAEETEAQENEGA